MVDAESSDRPRDVSPDFTIESVIQRLTEKSLPPRWWWSLDPKEQWSVILVHMDVSKRQEILHIVIRRDLSVTVSIVDY